ncbi:hypothetical protein M405DRAFT_606726 [Rhizopogon salebrosus TDB-379]|nr:hypothetical protein M405DRAFT_606726 [Rhizopogon salebrosus TDB-379]
MNALGGERLLQKKQYLSALAKISRHADILESLKPTKVVNNVEGGFVSKSGNLNLECTRFKTRIMKGTDQVCEFVGRSASSSERTVGTHDRSSTSKRRSVASGQRSLVTHSE